MFRFTHFAAAPAFVLLMGGTAHAALTADQVWSSWKDGAGLVGLQINAATESNTGGVLTLNGVSIAPAGETNAITISDMTLTEEADGSVTIRPGADIGFDGSANGGGKFDLAHAGFVITAHEGEAGALVYDYKADTLSAKIDAGYEGYSYDANTPAQRVTNLIDVNFEGLEGTYSDTPGTNRAFGLTVSAKNFGYDVTMDDPNLKMKQAQKSQTADVSLTGTLTLPSTIPLTAIQNAGDFGRALEEGLAFTFATKQGDSTGSVSQEDEYFPMQFDMTASGGEATGSFDKQAFAIKSDGAGMTFNLTSAAIPAPVEVTLGPVALDFLFPVVSPDTASDYHLKLSLSQFVLNDAVWGLFDPGAALKREPLDLAVDVSGKTKIDAVGLMAAEETGAPPPVPAPESLDINTLALKVAGAALNATGAFTFDNSMGMPMPLGQADVSVTGANALIDGLIATGLISQDDAMGARMMMGAFMKPGAEPDSLTSLIEAKEGGQIFVNGQQIQ
ncbi:DUF2125 domain-containing protein [Xinfangfangia pollutisoli]|uniref:DUF2125 domain-containing protein n=1 Tax=Xinfangfangia pollutisoli TaxID=2865960 RepID=UPI001CD5F5DE|nr:DUF2125 domain-containing protein [Xinfangfangia pollutisoli]